MIECSAPIPLRILDWPDAIDGGLLTLEQQGCLILLVRYIWLNQRVPNFEAARAIVGIRHTGRARRIRLHNLIEIAAEISSVRAPIDPHDRIAVYRGAGGVCHYCKQSVGDNWHIDHSMPVARGGRSVFANYRLSCGPCNMSKGRMTEDEFFAAIGGAA